MVTFALSIVGNLLTISLTYEYSTMLVIVVIRSRELLDNVVYSLN